MKKALLTATVALSVFLVAGSAKAGLVDGSFSGTGWNPTNDDALWANPWDGMVDAGWVVFSPADYLYNTAAGRAQRTSDATGPRYFGQVITTTGLGLGYHFKFDYDVLDTVNEDSTVKVAVVGQKRLPGTSRPMAQADALSLLNDGLPTGELCVCTVMVSNVVVKTGTGSGTADLDLSSYDLSTYDYLSLRIGAYGIGNDIGGHAYVDNAQLVVVPEPATFAVLGIAGLTVVSRRRK